MEKIADKAGELWMVQAEIRLAEVIDAELKALRQEIQDLKAQVSGIALGLKKEKPIPEPDLQRGDFVSYISETDMPNRKKGVQVFGVFHHKEQGSVWGYFQHPGGNFSKVLGWIAKDRVTFEFRPEK